jgi:glycosyltransferase involved in cell wall biosynthesis
LSENGDSVCGLRTSRATISWILVEWLGWSRSWRRGWPPPDMTSRCSPTQAGVRLPAPATRGRSCSDAFECRYQARTSRFRPGCWPTWCAVAHAFDVVHAHNFHSSPAPIAALAGVSPLVLSPYYHGAGHIRAAGLAYSLYRPFARQLRRMCSQVICCSTAEAAALRRDFPGLRAPVTVVPPGIDADSFLGTQPFKRSGKVVLAAGGIAPYKQVDRIALAVERLPEDHELVILGDGSGRRRIERLVADRGLKGRVRCLGHVPEPELRRWLSTAAVVVSMSRLESYGLTLYEGLAAGPPSWRATSRPTESSPTRSLRE